MAWVSCTRTSCWGMALLMSIASAPDLAGPPPVAKKPSDCLKQCVASTCSGKPRSCKAAITTIQQCLPQCQSGPSSAAQPAVSTSSQGQCFSACTSKTPDYQPLQESWVQHCTLVCTPHGLPPNATIIWLGP